jgi:glycosyltransferase involved in cell wall biosynthesis
VVAAVRVAYIVSRFPATSETFVLRELGGVAAEVEVELHALFPSPRGEVVHPDAERWLPELVRPGVGEGVVALARWLVRRPMRTLAVIGSVVAAHARHPRVLVRALVTLPLAAAHATRLGRVDHVHAHFATYPALAAWIAHRLTGVPYSFTAHAHDLFIHQAMLARKAADAAFVVAISDFNQRFLLERAAATVHVVHCGIDPARFAFAVRPVEKAAPRLLCVARLLEQKGHDVLLRALVGAPGARLDLVGDGPLRGRLEAEVARLGLGDRVRFHGAVPEPEVAALLAAADVFVLPSVIAPDGDMEGIPIVLMEAMAAGVPAVATRQSGVPELIADGETGYLAEPGDVDGLRAALGRALSERDPDARARAARAFVEAEFDQHRSARRMVELFSGAAGSSGRSAG